MYGIMKHRTMLVIAQCLASLLAISANWAFATPDSSPKSGQSHFAANSEILIFTAAAGPNVGDRCTNFSGATFSCDLPTAESSTRLPQAGILQGLIIHPAYNDVTTDLVVAVFVNRVPTALFTVIPAGSTQSHFVHADINIAAGDQVQIVTQGFTSENDADRLQYAGSVVYEYP
jgi:hypothetical protein